MDYADKNILAIDSTSLTLKLALRFGTDRIVKSIERTGMSHGPVIIKKIEDLLKAAALDCRALHAIVASIGPGSFTGLRIGLATAKGLAVALDIPVVGVSLFDLAELKLTGRKGHRLLIVPFKRDTYFVAAFEDDLCNQSHIKVVTKEQLNDILNNDSVAYIGFEDTEAVPLPKGRPVPEVLNYDAADLIRLGMERLSQGRIPDLAELEPLYLQKSQAEIRFAQRKRKQGPASGH